MYILKVNTILVLIIPILFCSFNEKPVKISNISHVNRLEIKLSYMDSGFVLRFVNRDTCKYKIILGSKKSKAYPLFVYLKLKDSGKTMSTNRPNYNWDFKKLMRNKSYIELSQGESFEMSLKFYYRFYVSLNGTSEKLKDTDSLWIYVNYSVIPREKEILKYSKGRYFIGKSQSNDLKIAVRDLKKLSHQ